eukprot:scaffold8477_cov112-Isochrysis_galbana.AAC.9
MTSPAKTLSPKTVPPARDGRTTGESLLKLAPDRSTPLASALKPSRFSVLGSGPEDQTEDLVLVRHKASASGTKKLLNATAGTIARMGWRRIECAAAVSGKI